MMVIGIFESFTGALDSKGAGMLTQVLMSASRTTHFSSEWIMTEYQAESKLSPQGVVICNPDHITDLEASLGSVPLLPDEQVWSCKFTPLLPELVDSSLDDSQPAPRMSFHVKPMQVSSLPITSENKGVRSRILHCVLLLLHSGIDGLFVGQIGTLPRCSR